MSASTPAMHGFLSRIALSALIVTGGITVCVAGVAGSLPNIIIVLADDLGYGDLSISGNQLIATPHLDRMAREGARFTSFYASANVCTPSRAGLLTGRYPIFINGWIIGEERIQIHTYGG